MPSQEVTLNSSTFIGNDKPDSLRQWRYFHNFYGTYQFSKTFSLLTGIDLVIEQEPNSSSNMNTGY